MKAAEFYQQHQYLLEMLPPQLRLLVKTTDMNPDQELAVLRHSYCDLTGAVMFHSRPSVSPRLAEELRQLRQRILELAPDQELPCPCPYPVYEKYLYRR